MGINDKIRALREDADLKQITIAMLIGLSQSYYSKQERGEKPFKFGELKKICLYFGISADYILGLPKGLKYIER